LQSLISAASRPIGELVPRRSIILRNEDGLASLVVHVVPFSPPSTVLMPDNERPVAGLFIVDCQRGTADRVDAFADLFQLTSAETRVLAQMILGEGLTIAARRLNIARSTARSHLDHILQKTGTHRQAELVRVFFETTIPWNGTVTLPNRARNKTPTTSGSCRSDAFTSRLQDRYPASSIQDRSSSQTTRDCSASDAFI